MKEFWSMAPLFRIVLLVAISPEEQWHFPVEMRLATIILCLPVAHLFHFQVSSWVCNIFALIDGGMFNHTFGDFCWGSCVSQILWKNILASITPISLGCWWDFELPGKVKYIHTYIHTLLARPHGAFQSQFYITQIQHNRIRNPNWQETTSWLFTSEAEDLNLGRPSTNPASGQSGTRTRDRRIASPTRWPLGHAASFLK